MAVATRAKSEPVETLAQSEAREDVAINRAVETAWQTLTKRYGDKRQTFGGSDLITESLDALDKQGAEVNYWTIQRLLGHLVTSGLLLTSTASKLYVQRYGAPDWRDQKLVDLGLYRAQHADRPAPATGPAAS